MPAMPTAATKLMTAEDLLALGPDSHGELVRGRLVKMAPASWGHGVRGNKAANLISNHIYSNQLGEVFTAETGFLLDRDAASTHRDRVNRE
jgi:Uma2 family endonuclease